VDWKLFALTFGSVFLAELGDKTQLATLALSGGSRKPWVVFAAASLALVAATALGAALGGLLSRHVSEAWMGRIAGAILLLAGTWMLLAGFRKTA
jgi:putative Ca2+/H+ antiporter (TMEM165/GDT1 family)